MNATGWTFALMVITSLAMLFGCDVQSKLLYHPTAQMPSKDVLAASRMQFWPASSGEYRGFVDDTKIRNIKGTIIVFHGNAGTAADRSFYIKALSPLGYRVILAEYPMYGARGGKLGEESFVKDALETLSLTHQQYGGPLFLIGESLGCGVAAAAAKDTSVKIDGIILITPWDTLLSVAKAKFPWLPVRLLMKDKYDSIGNLKGYQGRIAIIGAERDEIIPIVHATSLYQSLSGSKAMWVIKGVGHNDWPMSVNEAWWDEIMKFIDVPS